MTPDSINRIGLIVPSSNTTIETEMPQMLRRRGREVGEEYSFHSSRAVLHSVDEESLGRMVGQLDRCVNELLDSRVDALVYACLVALMAQGPGAHRKAEEQIGAVLEERGIDVAVSTSAGALLNALEVLELERVAIITPYVPALTEAVAAYLTAEGYDVVSKLSLAVEDNLAVGRLSQDNLLEHALNLDLKGADGLIISACVQMPSLKVVDVAEKKLGIPVLSASTAGVYDLLTKLGLDPVVSDAGSLLSGTRSIVGETK